MEVEEGGHNNTKPVANTFYTQILLLRLVSYLRCVNIKKEELINTS